MLHDIVYVLITALTFIVILGVLVLIHELGHFLTARLFGVRVEEFGLGFPPRVYPRKPVVERLRAEGKTVYSFNLLPLGGFVRLAGENGVTTPATETAPTEPTAARDGTLSLSGGPVAADDPGAFASKPAWQRAIVLAAGAFNNMALAMLLVFFIFAVIGTPRVGIAVVGVAQGSPAAGVDIQPGDVMRRIDGVTPQDQYDVRTIVANHQGQPVTLELQRGSAVHTVSLVPRGAYPCDQGPIGVMTNPVNEHYVPTGLDKAAGAALSVPGTVIGGLASLIGNLGAGQQLSTSPSPGCTQISAPSAYLTFNGQLVTEGRVGAAPGVVRVDPCLPPLNSSGSAIAGPIGIIRQVGCEANAISTQGWVPLLTLVVELSATLAVMNLLPIPALDGGRLLFVLISVLARRRIRPEVEGLAHALGMAALLLLMFYVSWNDLLNLLNNRPAF